MGHMFQFFSTSENLFLLMLFLPLVGSFIGGVFANKRPLVSVGYIVSALVSVSLLVSCYFLFLLASGSLTEIRLELWNFIRVGGVSIDFSFMLDRIGMVMVTVVTFVSSMVHFYSIWYMEGENGFNRFFCYLSAFVFFMLVLVCGDNLLVLFVGWEGVGLCSYLLIGFWYEKSSANLASMEAFIVNRVADVGMLLGLLLAYFEFGTLKYSDIFQLVSSYGFENYSVGWLCVLLFIGAMGKSAQFPFHTWLSNAMEGPTPVSALMHAATMVTAGVYLVIRLYPLYATVPNIGYFVSCLGAFVSIFSALMAATSFDLKKIIAYSTLSQLGYMFVAVGLGAWWVSLFHLFTHAFFKSLIFLCAGNVMHAMGGHLDIRNMGGLYKSLRSSALLMLVGSAALCGIFPFSGFFSKDKILEVAFASQSYYLWFILFVTAGVTAFYSCRLLMLVFFAPRTDSLHGCHEVSTPMLFFMLPLAVLSFASGFTGSMFMDFVRSGELFYPLSISHFAEYSLIASILAFVLFCCLFSVVYYRNGYVPRGHGFVQNLLYRQYYIPELYHLLIVRPYDFASRRLLNFIEFKVLDLLVDFVGKFTFYVGACLRLAQNGSLSFYLQLMLFGVVSMLVLMIAF